MSTFSIDEYLKYSLEMKAEEIVLRDELMQWLPDSIIDGHTHCGPLNQVIEFEVIPLNKISSTFPYFSLEQSKSLRKTFYPGKHIRSLAIPMPFQGIDHGLAHRYLLSRASQDLKVALFANPEGINVAISALRTGKFSALKMYRLSCNPPAEKIYQFFKPEILEEVQTLGIPIILHLPKSLGQCVDDVKKLLGDFPCLKIVLAHVGLSYELTSGLKEAFKFFSDYKSLFIGTSIVTSEGVFSEAIRTFGAERIIFGSDEPYNLIRGVIYKHPELGPRWATEYLYHWVNQKEYESLRSLVASRCVTHIHWQNLLALKKAIEKLKERAIVKELIFRKNAEQFFFNL